MRAEDPSFRESDAFSSLFPFGISSKQSLTARAFNGSIDSPFFSAVWRHFLLIFPSRRSQILTATDWLSALNSSRSSYAKQLDEHQPRLDRLKKSDNLAIITSTLGKTLIDLNGSLTSPVLAKLLQAVSLLVDEKSSPEYAECVAFLVAHFYHVFSCESRPNFDGSPRSVLMDSEFIMHDVFGCVKKVIGAMELFFSRGSIGEAILTQIKYMVGRVNPFVETGPGEADLPGILNIYHKLFAMYAEPGDLHALWTMLFSRVGDLTIFHYFYACIYLVTGKAVPDAQPMPVLLYGKQFQRDFEGAVAEKGEWETAQRLCEVIEELISMMKGESEDCIDENRRRVMKYQLAQIIKIARGSGEHPDELIPADVILETLSK